MISKPTSSILNLLAALVVPVPLAVVVVLVAELQVLVAYHPVVARFIVVSRRSLPSPLG